MVWRRVHRRPVLDGRVIWQELQGLTNGNEFRLGGTRGPARSKFPFVNAWENEDGIVITAEIPGVDTDNLDISIDENSLTLSGRRSTPLVPEDAKVFRHERRQGDFSRTFELPFRVNVDEVVAELRNGLLRLELPRLPEEKPRKIEIKSS